MCHERKAGREVKVQAEAWKEKDEAEAQVNYWLMHPWRPKVQTSGMPEAGDAGTSCWTVHLLSGIWLSVDLELPSPLDCQGHLWER